ncbi:MAG TPA: hypothetical protein VFA20_04760 [Myxococcaceae bacterium]|nr:hypothetical protein [Myxococcaceae bacterium]
MHRFASTLALLSAMLCASPALAARDQRVLKAIDLFDRAEFTRAKDLLATLVDAPQLSDEDRLQARIYLAASYYGLGDRASAKAQFLMLVRRYPRVELDPGLFLPEVVDLFHQARMEVLKEGPAPATPPQPATDKPRPAPTTTAATPLAPAPSKPGFGATTFLPFGAGQFARGDATMGHVFLWSEVGALALAAGAMIHFQYLKKDPSRPWDFSGPAYVENVGYATAVQHVFGGALVAAGVIAVAGVAESSLHATGVLALRLEPGPGGIAVRF